MDKLIREIDICGKVVNGGMIRMNNVQVSFGGQSFNVSEVLMSIAPRTSYGWDAEFEKAWEKVMRYGFIPRFAGPFCMW